MNRKSPIKKPPSCVLINLWSLLNRHFFNINIPLSSVRHLFSSSTNAPYFSLNLVHLLSFWCPLILSTISCRCFAWFVVLSSCSPFGPSLRHFVLLNRENPKEESEKFQRNWPLCHRGVILGTCVSLWLTYTGVKLNMDLLQPVLKGQALNFSFLY